MNIEYYYSIASPYAYLGSKKLRALIEKYSLKVDEIPVDLVGKVFVSTGGVPVPKRHLSRQKNRFSELIRWSEENRIHMNIKPKFFPPSDPHLPAYFLIASIEMGIKLEFGEKILKCLWSEEKDISDINVIKSICLDLKIKFDEIEKLAYSEKVKSIYNSNSEKAIKNNVFGAPTFILENELFWGQDSLYFLKKKLENRND